MSADGILCGLIKMGESISPELFTSFQGSKQSLRYLIIDVPEPLFWGCCSKPGVWCRAEAGAGPFCGFEQLHFRKLRAAHGHGHRRASFLMPEGKCPLWGQTVGELCRKSLPRSVILFSFLFREGPPAQAQLSSQPCCGAVTYLGLAQVWVRVRAPRAAGQCVGARGYLWAVPLSGWGGLA